MDATNLTVSEIVHRLLFQALLEMREQGREQKNKVVFHLADLFHNIALEMGNAARGRISYEDMLELLGERAKEKGCEKWLQQSLTQIHESFPDPGLARENDGSFAGMSKL